MSALNFLSSVMCGNSENLASDCTQCPKSYGKESCSGEHCAFVSDDDINYRCTEKSKNY